MTTRSAVVFLLLFALAGCAAEKEYSAYFAHEPRSILVVPALNETTSVDAQLVYMTTVTRPLAERGFYVFPVYLTESLLRDLGLTEAGLVHELPVDRFREHFGADAVLFVTIKDWSNKYAVLQTSTGVTVSFVLKDTRTGTLLWENTQSAVRDSGDGGGGLVGMLVAAAVTYAINEMTETDYRPLAQQANMQAFATPARAFRPGRIIPTSARTKTGIHRRRNHPLDASFTLFSHWRSYSETPRTRRTKCEFGLQESAGYLSRSHCRRLPDCARL